MDDTKPIILTMDGHDTHENAELKRVVYDLQDTEAVKVEIFCFPSKTTHKCQPLDVLIFSAIQRKWQAVCKDYLRQGMPMNRFTVIPAYVDGTWEALTKSLIARAFEKAGLYPVNRAVFSPEDFAPSQASSIVAHVPPSFPTDFPSSDPYIPSSESEWLPGSDMDVEDDCSWSDVDEISHAPNEPPPGTPEEGHGLSPAPEQARPSASEGLGDALDIAPDTEHVTEPVSGFMIAMANLESRAVPATRSASMHIEPIVAATPRVVSFEEDNARSREDLLSELRAVRGQLTSSHQSRFQLLSQISATNAHCTMALRELSAVRVQLGNATKKKERGSQKIKARWVTSDENRALFEAEEAERIEKERVAAEKQKQKEAESALHELQVADDALHREFTGRISSYKKNDLWALSIALGISDKGTNAELTTRIKAHFDQCPETWENPRFSGLTVTTRASQKGRAATQAMPGQQVDRVDEGSGSDASADEAPSPRWQPFAPYPPNAFASSSSYHTGVQYDYDPALNTFSTLFQGLPN